MSTALAKYLRPSPCASPTTRELSGWRGALPPPRTLGDKLRMVARKREALPDLDREMAQVLDILAAEADALELKARGIAS